ncbi:PREDICTED: uncharacterized protein LOC109212700 [Nicotiana attenuata]|uniref:Pesticidal crystal cry8Ba protein n=1 Tax=Nicotiana attenuata TaxID=49451 RepID=A0A1J6KIC7_NICAT|nr:PREDICTED: uncharacterized protein LOC109212700 [Nicotiana attenuata]OIT28396.1 hypothetical protein A4A49_22589 [Nicotiana attenuata]
MFTEGLDNNALKWVREGSGQQTKEVPYSISSQRSRIDPIGSMRNGGRNVGLPPPSKFRSGHLSGVIPVSRVIPGNLDESASASDNDMITDSEEEVYGGRYSLDSSPHDDRIPSTTAATQRYYNLPQRRATALYASDSVYSDDVSSSVETLGRGRGYVADRLMRGANRYPIGSSVYTEEESSDSAASSEFSSTQVGTNNGTVPRSTNYASEGYASSIPSRLNTGNKTQKDMTSGNLQKKAASDEEVPSAPPFCSSTAEIKEVDERVPASRTVNVQSTAEDSGLSTKANSNIPSGLNDQVKIPNHSDSPVRTTAAAVESGGPSGSYPARLPTFHASALGPWHRVLAYDACVRLCLHAWARGCLEAPMFLESECALLRNAFRLQQVLLQSEEELMANRSSELPKEAAATKPKQMVGKMKIQVRKVKMGLDPPTGCSFSSLKTPKIKMESVRYHLSNLRSTFSSGWQAVRKVRFAPRMPANGSFSRQSLAYMQASTQYIKQVSGLLKIGVTSLRSSPSSYEVVQETYYCLLRLKSSMEEDAIKMQPGSGETHIFFPDSFGDDLIVEVLDSNGKHYGRVLAQVATIAEEPGEKLRWWSVYREPEHELVGKVQLFINYSATFDENSHLKCGSVAETVAYDLALEVAMKIQQFQQRNLTLHGPWKWLLTEFASYYGVSDAYTRLRYLSYVMDVATPTADCLTIVHDLLLPVIMKGRSKSTLSHQENRILGEVEDQIEQIFALVFENYKSLDESTPSGIMDVFKPATGVVPPALEPAVKLYSLLHDILSPEAQNTLYSYFQAAAKKRSRRHLTETDEYVSGNNEGLLMDAVTVSTAYKKMKSLCMNIRNEIFTDMEIHNQNILPSFIDLPNLSSAIYSAELCCRLRAFLIACPPAGPSPHVTDLVIATADFQRDLACWNIKPVKGGVDAKELFHLYIILWIQDKRLSLLESCKLDKVKWSGVKTQHSTTPFVDEMYERLKETLTDYEVIICRWPEYTFALENAIADIEKAILDALEKQYADVLSPLKENLTPKKFGLKYVQKLAKRSVCPYIVPDDLGILLNSMKRMLDILRPKIEQQFKSWGSCIPEGGNTAPGERLSEVTVMLRSKFRNYVQAVIEKLAENTKLQSNTKLKKILQDSKESVIESDIRSKMQPLKEQLASTINHLYTIFEPNVFIASCRGYWDRMGQDVLSFLESRKENRAWYKGSRIAVSILDDTFASQMQQLLGNSLQEKDLEPPRSILEVRSMLCRDATNNKGPTYYY